MALFKKRSKALCANNTQGARAAALSGAGLPRSVFFNANPKIQRQQLKVDLNFLLGHGAGLRYLARLLTLSGTLGGSYAPSGPYATAYNEGLRRMGLFILADIQENAPDLLPKLLLLCLQRGPKPEEPGAPLQ